jgi:hypothetical protein
MGGQVTQGPQDGHPNHDEPAGETEHLPASGPLGRGSDGRQIGDKQHGDGNRPEEVEVPVEWVGGGNHSAIAAVGSRQWLDRHDLIDSNG